VFGDQYQWSLSRLVDAENNLGKGSDAARHLVEHVMVYYWQGLVAREAGGLLETMFASANTKLRAHAITFVGRSLMESKTIPIEPVERLQELVDWRLGLAKATSDPRIRRSTADELIGFGWWFVSDKLNGDWALERLIEILRITAGVEPEHLVAQRLLVLLDTDPRRVAEAVRLMVRNPKPYSVLGWHDEAKQILTRLLVESDPATRELAKEAIDVLLTYGMTDFGALLGS
jgi:hypothetical protein